MARKQKSAKPPKPPKPTKPRTKDLRAHLRGIISPLAAYRIEAMSKAFQWYDIAKDYVLFKSKGILDPKAAKNFDLAVKCRKQGIGTNSEAEKETSFRTALKFYEQFCAILRPPTVAKFYEVYEKKKVKLDKKHDSLQDKFDNVIEVLMKSIMPLSHDGGMLSIVAGDIESARKTDPNLRQIIYSKDTLKRLKTDIRMRGVLPVVLEELPYFAQAKGLEHTGDGKFLLNPVKKMEAMELYLRNFVHYCTSPDAPNRLVKKAGGVVRTESATPGAPKAPRAPRASNKERVDGLFAVGSVRAVLYQALLDGNWHDKKDLKKLVGTGVEHPIMIIGEKGARMSLFTIEDQKTKVRMVKTPPVV